MKNIFTQEKLMLWSTFNPVLVLTDFRTARPNSLIEEVPWFISRLRLT